TKQNKATSVAATTIRLRGFLGDLDASVSDVDARSAQATYDRYRTTKSKWTKRVPAVDTHRNVLAETKTFFDWLVKRKLIGTNPFEGVEGVGRRRHGKAQLRIDESRTWLATAFKRAQAGDDGAVAAMMTLLMGMRASEVIQRVARDVDDGGRLLWIPDSKTEAGRRTLEGPEMLQPFLVRLAASKPV